MPRLTVAADDEGARVDQFVATRLHEPRAQAQARVERGEVTVGGRVVRKSFRVTGGQQVDIEFVENEDATARPPTVAVRYDDDHVLVVDKPPGLVVHAGAGVRTATLVEALQVMGVPLAAGDDPARPGIVHRLDRGTSGLLVVAKTSVAMRGLRGMFDRHDIERRYLALVDGTPAHGRATIDAPIARHPGDRIRFRTAPDGRTAVTHYEVERSWETVSLVGVRLETGRTHQVRVHMSAIGHPVSGDLTYGASRQRAERLGLDRPALHAAHLAFDHPVTGARIALDEPLPSDLRRAVERLG